MMIAQVKAAIPPDSTVKDKLIALLQDGGWHCLSCTQIYQTFRQSDSLARLLSAKEKDELFTNEDPSVRYYAFLNTLGDDEEEAFERLGKILEDTADVCFICCMISEEKINKKLFSHYYTYLYMKYHEGTGGTIDARSYSFGKITGNKKRWKEKTSGLMQLAKNSRYYLQLVIIKDSLNKYFKSW
jgi:hypothetical protein